MWSVLATGGEPALAVRAGPRAAWTASNAGLHVLDPDATSGPALEFAAFDGTRRSSVRLPGEPEDYVEPLPGTAVSLAASPDGSWVICLRRDPAERKLMLVDNFR